MKLALGLVLLICMQLFTNIQAKAQEKQNTLKSPSLGVNTLFLYQNSNFHQKDSDPTNPDQQPNGLRHQETELSFFSDVDTYARLNVLLSIHNSYDSDGTEVEESWNIEPEEIYAESDYFSNFIFKVGKFKASFGKHNIFHTHAYPFIHAPLANTFLLGDEGFNDLGLSAEWLLPFSWYSEITLQFLRGKGENIAFSSPRPNQGVVLVKLKNLIDLTSDLTFELGLSLAEGENTEKNQSLLYGSDLTLKWKPAGDSEQAVSWTTEYIARDRKSDTNPTEKSSGLASWLEWSLTKRWAATYRYDFTETKNSFDPTVLFDGNITRNSVGLKFIATEFSSFKIEYNQTKYPLAVVNDYDTEKAFFIQANFAIGAHPAHKY